MKKWCMSLFVVCFLVACTEKPVEAPEPLAVDMYSESQRSHFHAYVEAFEEAVNTYTTIYEITSNIAKDLQPTFTTQAAISPIRLLDIIDETEAALEQDGSSYFNATISLIELLAENDPTLEYDGNTEMIHEFPRNSATDEQLYASYLLLDEVRTLIIESVQVQWAYASVESDTVYSGAYSIAEQYDILSEKGQKEMADKWLHYTSKEFIEKIDALSQYVNQLKAR